MNIQHEFLVAPTYGVQWFPHGAMPGERARLTVVDGPDDQADLMRLLLTERGIAATPVIITSTADPGMTADVNRRIVETAVERMRRGEYTSVDVMRLIWPLAPALADLDSRAPRPECARGYWLDRAFFAVGALSQDGLTPEEEDEHNGHYDDAVSVLAGVIGHGRQAHGGPGAICDADHRAARRAAREAATR